jgi:hypothetical protein
MNIPYNSIDKDPRQPSDNGSIEFIKLQNDNFLEPVVASKMLPEWYKAQPATEYIFPDDKNKDLTIKRCVPFLDAMSVGYYLVTTIDHFVEWDGDKPIIKHEDQRSISSHEVTQFKEFLIPYDYALPAYKWNNPYLIKTPKGYSVKFSHPSNFLHLPFISLSGVVDTDDFFNVVSFPFFIKRGFSGLIPKGTPIIQIIPFKREEWNASIGTASADMKEKHKKISDVYESGRYNQDGSAKGGMYKKEYRKKKNFT